jgi:hypothetical protein
MKSEQLVAMLDVRYWYRLINLLSINFSAPEWIACLTPHAHTNETLENIWLYKLPW